MIYPLAYVALTSALTVVIIAAGLAGRAGLAGELAVIQGALLATFTAFSANTRSLILQGHGDLTAGRLLAKRLIALPLLAIAAYVLCVVAAGIPAQLAAVLIVRRACEWLAEVRLCEIEVAADRRGARRSLAVQAAVTAGVAAILAAAPASALPALWAFAVSPLFSALPRIGRAAFRLEALRATLRGATPYIGSTAIEGISTYVLRVVVFLIAGREMAGLFFTAFVLGSFVATLFGNVVGPTLALRGKRLSRAVPWGMAAAGVAIAAVALATRLGEGLGKPGYFWLALGLSLLGGAVMIGAQHIRLRLFDERRGDLLFGPDVLRNLSVIVAAPVLYHLVAPPALASLYLVTALLTLFFYWGAARHASREPLAPGSAALRGAIALGIVLPLFFLASGRVYHNPGAPLLDPGGGVFSVPLPVSLAACFAGIVLLGRYRNATLALGTIFFLFVAMVLTTVVASAGNVALESRKFLLLFQFLVPAFALVLGQMLGAPPQGLRVAAVAFAAVVALVVPVQLLRSIGYGENELYHDVVLFSIYQHLQYVPSVLACAYLVALYTLWDAPRLRRLLIAFAPLFGWYIASSYSTLAIAFLAVGVVVLAVVRRGERAALLCAALAIGAGGLLLVFSKDNSPMWQKFASAHKAVDARIAAHAPGTDVSRQVVESLPGPAQVRLYYWKLFARGIVESERAALFGHPQAIDRSVAPSAHNYYLDFVYNFGMLAFLPFAWLIGCTLLLVWRGRGSLWTDLPLLGLALAVGFGLALESMFKVPLRQPYPGIFFFFLWGLLIARLQSAGR